MKLDLTTRIGRITGSVYTNGVNGSQYFSQLLDGGEPFYFVEETADNLEFMGDFAYPNVTISNGTVSWVYVLFNRPGAGVSPARPVYIRVGTF